MPSVSDDASEDTYPQNLIMSRLCSLNISAHLRYKNANSTAKFVNAS